MYIIPYIAWPASAVLISLIFSRCVAVPVLNNLLQDGWSCSQGKCQSCPTLTVGAEWQMLYRLHRDVIEVASFVTPSVILITDERWTVPLMCPPWFISSGPLIQIRSSLLCSTSDSNLNKYSTINRIPLITLNFSETNVEKRCPSPPSSDKTVIAPKVKDRTHNVTDKVTQVRIT